MTRELQKVVVSPEVPGKVLLADAREIIESARTGAYRAVNAALVQRNWLLGKRIAEEELKGERAEYGRQVVKELAEQLTAEYGSGFDFGSLYKYVQFYRTFKILESLTPKSGGLAHAKFAKGGSGMKIVKWTRGLDCPGTGKQTQRYHAFGDDFPGMPEEEYSRLWADAERVVVDCIRRNGFKFDGNYHQYGEFGMPLFDDGTVFFVSWRHWGHLMYRAWNPDGNDSMGYCKYAFGWDIPEEEYKYPQSETDFLQPDEVGNEGAA